MPTTITLQLDTDTVARLAGREFLRGVKERARDLRPVWPGIRGVIYRNQIEVFDAEGDVDGMGEWAPLKNGGKKFHGGLGYATWKGINYPGRKILELTGKLRRMVTGVTPNAFVQENRTSLIFGTDYDDYSAVPGRPRSQRDRLTGDQGGILDSGRAEYYPMEARTIFRIKQSSADEMADLVTDYLTQTRSTTRNRATWFLPRI